MSVKKQLLSKCKQKLTWFTHEQRKVHPDVDIEFNLLSIFIHHKKVLTAIDFEEEIKITKTKIKKY